MLTIPSIRYVIDCGVRKEFIFDPYKKSDILTPMFISRLACKLRKDTCGVSKTGICYRIYNQENYMKMSLKEYPDLLTLNPFKTIIKIFQYRADIALSAEFIEPFSSEVKECTFRMLKKSNAVKDGMLTTVGENMAKLPFEAAYSRLILMGIQWGLAFEAAVLVGFLLVKGTIFLFSEDKEVQRAIDVAKLHLIQNDSDMLSYIFIYKKWMEQECSLSWSENHYINYNVLKEVQAKVNEIIKTVSYYLETNVTPVFSNTENSASFLTEMLLDCFQDNLCVFTGHYKSGYRVLHSSSMALIHPSSLVGMKQNLPQFVIFGDFLFTNSNYLIHVSAVSEELILKRYADGLLEFDYSDIFEKNLICRLIAPVGEKVMNELFLGEKDQKLINFEKQIQHAAGSNIIFIEPSMSKGCISLYALPGYIDYAQCAVEDILKSRIESILDEQQIKILELKKDQNKVSIDVNWMKGAQTISIAIHVQEQIYNVISNEPSKNELPHNEITPAHHYSIKLSLSRRPCRGEGFVNFTSDAEFMKARKLALKYVHMIGRDVFIEVSKNSSNQLRVTGIPPETVNRDLMNAFALLLPDISVKSAEVKYISPFLTSDSEIQELKSKICEKCEEYKHIVDCKIVVMKPELEDLDTLIYINMNNDEALVSISEAVCAKVAKNKKIIKNLHYNFVTKCSILIAKALKPRFDVELTKLKSDMKTSDFPNDCEFNLDINMENDVAIITLSSSNYEILKLLQNITNTLLAGEVLNTNNVKELGKLFCHGGYVWLRSVEKTESVFILENYKTKTIRLYGSENNCFCARERIIKFLNDAENEVVETIILTTERSSNMLLKKLLQEYGANLEPFIEFCELRSAVLDIKSCELILHGRRESIEKAENCLRELSVGLDPVNANDILCQEICPVCACPALNLTYRLEHCGHLYCCECIEGLVEQAQFPIQCCAEKCGKDIVLEDIKRILNDDVGKINNLVEKSVKDYLEKNVSNVIYCPAPDCPMFFFKNEHSSTTRVNCMLCHNEICVKCSVLYHGGYTCEMYQQSKNDPDFSFKVWQKGTTKCKQCPRCKAAIEKFEGCNRMTCVSCKAVFCWICSSVFPNSNAVYNHIGRAHRGQLFT